MSTILFYDVVLFVHILAVVLAFGVVFTYPLLDAHMRKSHPGDLAALHRMQVFLTRHLISPMMIVVLAAGAAPSTSGRPRSSRCSARWPVC